MSKGHKRRPRPEHVSSEEFDRRWEKTFGGDQNALLNSDQNGIFREPNPYEQLELPFDSEIKDEGWETALWRDI